MSTRACRAAADPDPRFAWAAPARTHAPRGCPRHGPTLRVGAPRAWLAWLGAGALLALAWALLASVRATTGEPVCALRHLAGLDCPTCGLTRALGSLARGGWREALALHPWAPALALQAAAAWALWGAWLGGRLRARPDRWCPAALAANLAALALLWLVRVAAGTLPG